MTASEMTPIKADSSSGMDSEFTAKSTQPVMSKFPWKTVIACGIGFVAMIAAFSAKPIYDLWEQRQRKEFRRQESRFRDECLTEHDNHDWGQVESIGREWTKWNPGTSDGWLLLGDALQQQGHYAEAVSALLKVPETSHKAVPAFLEASHLQFGIAGQPLEGVETCRQILKLDPQCIEARRRLIFYNAITLQRNEMLAEIRKAIEAQAAPPEAYVYLILADHLMFSNGFELTLRWKTARPDVDLFAVAHAIHMNQTLDHAEKKDAESESARDARYKSIRSLLETFPASPQLLRYFLDKAILDAQLTEVGRLLAMLPEDALNDSLFWRNRGWYLRELGQLEQSAKAYQTSLELHSLDWRARFEMSDVERQLGHKEEAGKLQSVGLRGKELRKQLVQLPNALDVSPELMKQIELYARLCGDRVVADSIRTQLRQ